MNFLLYPFLTTDQTGISAPPAPTFPYSVDPVDNGNPATVEPVQSDQRHALSGQCPLIVRSERGSAGPRAWHQPGRK
jgi:hypothetical protein